MSERADVAIYREDAPFETIHAIRRDVFVEGQGVPESEEIDGRDADAVQFLARVDGDPVGTARLRMPEPGVGKVERVAVRQSKRNAGVGRAIMEAVEDAAREEGLDRLVLHGQVAVEEFYTAMGYERTSDVYEEVGIPHVTMEREL